MAFSFESVGLWTRTLASQRDDANQHAREKLRSALLNMRDHAAELVKLIPEDCKNLTVHDISHLDALWEMADMICGPNFEINPAEAFVFGASVLLHDAGMSVASYPGGIEQLRETTEWRDSTFSACRRAGITPSEDLVQSPPNETLSEILFNVLRALHAKHAEDLALVTWPLPGSKDSVRLLEDLQLRTSYGRTIGRIAHSHNWNIERVVQQLRNSVGAAPDLPQPWKVDEVKVACMLRCADAAHIDHRRAPSMLYALRRPRGSAEAHWNFQNKLNKPTMVSGALTYTSGQDFEQSDAQAWWLCFDTISMINKELQDSNAILQDNSLQPFAAKRVTGAEGPSMLARQVQVVGWRPVDAEIKVGDPVHLAKTLGGKNLYGDSVFAPIRELLQNAVDSVRARRRLEKRSDDWGKVRLVLEERHDGKEREIWLHVDDNGIGMSERTLVGPLLDFGNSFWNSTALQEEWPGLESSGILPIGKFGIGFFSVFVLGDNVVVTSRRYDAAAADTRSLEFKSIVGRPILRDASQSELPPDFNTRISVKVTDELREIETRGEQYRPSGRSHQIVKRRTREILESAIGRILFHVSAVDVQIELRFDVFGQQRKHEANWLTVEPNMFLEEVFADFRNNAERDIWRAGHVGHLTTVEDAAGRTYGRAALAMYQVRGDPPGALGGFSVGGFLTRERTWFVGAMDGDTQDASRIRAERTVPSDALENWATNQAKLIDKSRFELHDLWRAAHQIHWLGGDPGDLPFGFAGGKFVSLSELRAIAIAMQQVHILLRANYEGKLQLVTIDDIRVSSFGYGTRVNVVALEWARTNDDLFEDDDVSESIIGDEGRIVDFSELGEARLHVEGVASILEQTWSHPIELKVEAIQIYQVNFFKQPDPEWVLTLAPRT